LARSICVCSAESIGKFASKPCVWEKKIAIRDFL
jgi:hypothetical protein